jgi:hypothetical protein
LKAEGLGKSRREQKSSGAAASRDSGRHDASSQVMPPPGISFQNWVAPVKI